MKAMRLAIRAYDKEKLNTRNRNAPKQVTPGDTSKG